LFRAWNISPLRQQLAVPPKHENLELRALSLSRELRRRCSVKIRYDKDVAPGVAANFLCVVPSLKVFCLSVYAMPDEPGRDPTANRSMIFRETNNGDHFVIRIAQTTIGHAVSHSARLAPIGRSRQHQHGDVSISSGKFVAIDVGKVERVGRTARKRPVHNDIPEAPGYRSNEKELKCAHIHK
jgi:hypothetical protein